MFKISKLFRFLLAFGLGFHIVEEGGGGSLEPSPAPSSDGSIAVDAPVVSSPAPAPATMLDAINARFDPEITDLATGQPRDPLGRFAHKDANGTPIAAPVAAAPVVPGAPAAPAAPVVKPAVVPGAPDDLTMPEGLLPKSQERFQKLANEVKELRGAATERDEARGQVEYIRNTFHEHGIKKEQFEQAAQVIGLMNKGDWQGALQVLDEQRRQISLLTGQPLAGVDALSDFPDLRAAVDNLQVTESHALEIARARGQQLAGQQAQQQQQQAQQTQQQEQQAFHTAQAAVDTLCKGYAATDMDWPVIEAQLAPVIPRLLKGVPMNQWENTVRAQYDVLKGMASKMRVSSPNQGVVLRPTGQGAPGAAAPRTMHEAMWGPKP